LVCGQKSTTNSSKYNQIGCSDKVQSRTF
jgi:hypothetical protein